VVCFDEKPYQLVGETRVPVKAKPGQPRPIDYEYCRNGTANIFVFVGARHSWRHAKVTGHRGNIDFAECMRDLVDVHFPDAEKIRVVMDNLSTHRLKNLYEAFPPEEARRIIRKLEIHHTPKHASWLNMAEIESRPRRHRTAILMRGDDRAAPRKDPRTPAARAVARPPFRSRS
jgi:hypothetical protein